MKPLSKLYYLITGLFALFLVICYWKYVSEMESWYPIVGAFIASHGALIGTIAHYIITKRLSDKK